MRELEWTPDAKADLLSILDYISNDNPDAAIRLMQGIHSKVGRLMIQPKLYRPGRVAGTREMVVSANFIVVYEETESVLRILRVLHAAQRWPA